MAEQTLDAMAAGGMYDVVGGGFHRYSVDERWLVPHFEKMLYDNALLASAYLHAWLVTGQERHREVVEETLEYMVRELALEGGGLASAQDADTDGVEGLTYTWTPDEAAAVGLDPALLLPFEHGRLIVRGVLEPELRAHVLAVRSERPQPFRDDKAVASWNGLALAALADAGYRLERPDWIEAARGVAEFLLGPLSRDDGRLRRAWRDGRVSGDGFLEDYADVAHGLLELHIATGEVRWLHEARRLALLAVDLFGDSEHGGFFLSPSDGEALVARTKPLDDNPTPSGNSMLAHVLLRLARIWGDDELERQRRRGLPPGRAVATPRAQSAFGWTLCALDLWLAPPQEIAVVGAVESRVARAALDPVRPAGGRRGRPGRRRAAPRREGLGRRATCGLRVRALCLPGAGHRSGPGSTIDSSIRPRRRGHSRTRTRRSCSAGRSSEVSHGSQRGGRPRSTPCSPVPRSAASDVGGSMRLAWPPTVTRRHCRSR